MELSSGLQGGVQGATLGAQVGGVHGALIGGAIGLGLGLLSGDAEKKAIKKYNEDVVRNATTSLFDMRRQQNIQNMRTAQALTAYSDTARTTKSSYNAAYGATDIIGASADALRDTIQFQTDQAVAGEWFNFGTGIDNFNQTVDAVTNQAVSKLKRAEAGKAGGGMEALSQLAGLAGKMKGKGGAGGASNGLTTSEFSVDPND